MAIFNAVKYGTQSKGSLKVVLLYVTQDDKTVTDDGIWMVSGHNCVAPSCYLEMCTTKNKYGKTDGRQFYHFVQSFAEEDMLTPQEANAIGLELARRLFPSFEAVVATHQDTEHLHNHIVVNSVSFADGRKLHQNRDDLNHQREINDEICMQYGLSVIAQRKKQTRGQSAREYRAAEKGESWKLELAVTIDECMRYARTREEFVALMRSEGYEVHWTAERKNITYTCPNGRKCRDDKLHDDRYLKDSMELEFAIRVGQAPAIETGWEEERSALFAVGMASGDIVSDILRLGHHMEQAADAPVKDSTTMPSFIDRKRKRELMKKKIALGHKANDHEDEHQYEQRM